MNKQIKDMPLKTGIDGNEDILIQDNGVSKRIKSSELMDSVNLSDYYTKEEVDSKLDDLPKDSFLSVKDFGMIGDAELTYTSITVKNIEYPIQRYVGTDNTEVFNSIIQYCKDNNVSSLYIPKGNYMINASRTPIDLSNIKIYGDGEATKIIKTTLQFNSVENVIVSDLAVVGEYYDFDPVLKITTDSEYFEDDDYWNYLDCINMGYNSDGIQFKGTVDSPCRNITVQNCIIKMRANGITFEALDLDSMLDGEITVENVMVLNCRTKNIWWHGVNSRYTNNILVSGCTFEKHYVGMMCDFARGTQNSKMVNCYGMSTADFFKNDSTENGRNKNCIIANNTWYSCTEDEKNYKWYCGHTTGENIIIDSNQIFIRDISSGFRIAGQNTHFTNNHVVLENFIGDTYLFEIYSRFVDDYSGDLVISGNNIYNKTTHSPVFIKASTGTNRICMRDNNILGGFSQLLKIKTCEYLQVLNNRATSLSSQPTILLTGCTDMMIFDNIIKSEGANFIQIENGLDNVVDIDTICVCNNQVFNPYSFLKMAQRVNCKNLTCTNNMIYDLCKSFLCICNYIEDNSLESSNVNGIVLDNSIFIGDNYSNPAMFICLDSNNSFICSNRYINNITDTPEFNITFDIRETPNIELKDKGINLTVPYM